MPLTMASDGIDLDVISGSDIEFRAETIYFLVVDLRKCDMRDHHRADAGFDGLAKRHQFDLLESFA